MQRCLRFLSTALFAKRQLDQDKKPISAISVLFSCCQFTYCLDTIYLLFTDCMNVLQVCPSKTTGQQSMRRETQSGVARLALLHNLRAQELKTRLKKMLPFPRYHCQTFSLHRCSKVHIRRAPQQTYPWEPSEGRPNQ